MAEHTNNYPKLHNAMWPGVVGKGSGDGEPIIALDTLLELTSKAEYEGQKFDGVDLWLADPHVSIDSITRRRQARRRAHSRATASRSDPSSLRSGAAPAAARRWATPTSASASSSAVRKGMRHRQADARDGHPPDRRIRVDSSTSVEDWDKDPAPAPRRSPRPFARPARSPWTTARSCAIEGEICWGGMHSWRENVQAARGWSACPASSATRPTWRIRCSSSSAPTPRRTGCSPRISTGATRPRSMPPTKVADALRPWTPRFPRRPERRHDVRLRLPRSDRPALPGRRSQRPARCHQARRLLAARRHGNVTKTMRHICWDGCMFPNDVMSSRRPGTMCSAPWSRSATPTAGASREGRGG